jgi:Big-like domain-containing protein
MFGDHEREFHEKLLHVLEKMAFNLSLIRKYLLQAKSATLTSQGEEMLVPLVVGGKGAQATFTEFDGPNGTGNVVPPVGTVVFETDNAAVATIDATGKITAVGAGTCNLSGLDQGNNISAKDSQVVTAAAGAQSATITSVAL